jgi:hypothetical protein
VVEDVRYGGKADSARTLGYCTGITEAQLRDAPEFSSYVTGEILLVTGEILPVIGGYGAVCPHRNFAASLVGIPRHLLARPRCG